MLADRFVDSRLGSRLIAPGAYRPFPTGADRGFWDRLPDTFKRAAIDAAVSSMQEPWPELPATGYLDFTRTGSRAEFQNRSIRRRQRLALLAVAECVEHTGRFTDSIANALWSICEESSWVIPAHNFMHHANQRHNEHHLELADVTEPLIDLRAVETGATLALTGYLLGAELDAVSVFLRRRVAVETTKRLIEPFLSRDDFWWMGFKRYEHAPVNNWNPWCTSRILQVGWLVADDAPSLESVTAKAMRILEVFLEHLPDDGSCEEGPGYWSYAAGALYDGLELLDMVSNGAVEIWDDPLIAGMTDFITTVHIADDRFVNFADARPILTPDPALLYRMGRRTSNRRLLALAEQTYQRSGGLLGVLQPNHSFHRGLCLLELGDRVGTAGASETFAFASQGRTVSKVSETPDTSTEVWHPNLQMMVARDRESGLFVAAKGGHNDESHNHNDVGSFLLYCSGKPVIIDVGVGTYTEKTFHPTLRYTIWTMQSEFHNLPVIDGHGQRPGRTHRCDEARFDATETRVSVEYSIGHAWSEDAGVGSWKRRISLERGDRPGVEIADSFRLARPGTEIRWHFLLAEKPRVESLGVVLASNGVDCLRLDADGELTWRTERIDVEDAALHEHWGESVFRLVATERVRASGVRRFFCEPVSSQGRRRP